MKALTETADRSGLVDSMTPVESDADGSLFRATYATDRDPASLAVLAVIAAATDSDVTDLAPLHSVVDTDALDALLSDSGSGALDGRLSFQYEGFAVTVFGEGRVEARPGDRAA